MNMLLPLLFNRDGELNLEVADSISPSFIKGNVQQVSNFVFKLVSEMDLSDKFIIDNLDDLDLELVFSNNKLSEDTVINNIDVIIKEAIYRFKEEPDNLHMLGQLFDAGYSTSVYTKLAKKIAEEVFVNIQLDEEIIPGHVQTAMEENITMFLNANVTKIEKDFIFHSPFSIIFFLNAAIQRDDITLDDLVLRVDEIGMDEIMAFIEQIENMEDPSTLKNFEKKSHMIYYLAKLKLEQKLFNN